MLSHKGPVLPTASVTASTRPAILSWHDVGTRPWGVPSPAQATALLVAITAIGAALSFYRIGALSFWTDELFTAIFIDHPLNKIWVALWPDETNMILYYYIVYIWKNLLADPSDGALRSISAICSIVAIPTVYALAQALSSDRRFSRVSGLVAALLFSLNSFRIQYSQELRSYSLALFLGVLSSLFLALCKKNSKSLRLWVAYAITATAGIYSHYIVGFLILAHSVSLLFLFLRDPRRFPFIPVSVSILSILLLISPLILAALRHGMAFLAWIKPPSSTDIRIFGIQFTGGEGMSLLYCYFLGIVLTIALTTILKKKLNAVYEDDYWLMIFLLNCLLFPAITAIILTYYGVPLFSGRYFLPSLPYLAIFVSFGMTRFMLNNNLAAKMLGMTLLLSITILSTMGVSYYYGGTVKEDWREVIAFLTAECTKPGNLRLYYPAWSQELPSHYSTQVMAQDKALQDLIAHPDATAAIAMQSTDYRKICLIVSPQGTPTQRQTVRSLVQANYPNATPYKFAGDMEVDVYVK